MQGYQAYQTSRVASPICRAHVDGRRNAEVTFRRRPLWRLAQLLGLQPLVKHLARQVRPWRRRTAPWRRTTRRKLRRAWQEWGPGRASRRLEGTFLPAQASPTDASLIFALVAKGSPSDDRMALGPWTSRISWRHLEGRSNSKTTSWRKYQLTMQALYFLAI
ncbi:unnamed protein product [Effrenium voratum]|nr:unnamed protein product [Effrenium voratum]